VNKPMKNLKELKINRLPELVKVRRQARESFLKEIGVDAANKRQMIDTVLKYITRTKLAGEQVLQNKSDHQLKYKFLLEAMGLFLLTSESKYLVLNMQQYCARQGIKAQSNTTLLLLILRTLGPYLGDRKEAHRDSVCVEFAMLQGATPSALPDYFGKSGQGLDATYHRATAKQKDSTRISVLMKGESKKRYDKVADGNGFFLYALKTSTHPIPKKCLINVSQLRAALEYMERAMAMETSGSRKASVIAPKGVHHAIGKRLRSPLQAASPPGNAVSSAMPKRKRLPDR
jgi:hypothetical protein